MAPPGLSEVAPDRARWYSHRRLALLATRSLTAPAVLAWQGLRHQPIDLAAIEVGSVVLFLLVVLRMAGLVARVQDQAAAGWMQAQGPRVCELGASPPCAVVAAHTRRLFLGT